MSHNLLQAGMSSSVMQDGVNQSMTQQLHKAGSAGVVCQQPHTEAWVSGAQVPMGAVPQAMLPQCPTSMSQEYLVSQVRNKPQVNEYIQAGVL